MKRWCLSPWRIAVVLSICLSCSIALRGEEADGRPSLSTYSSAFTVPDIATWFKPSEERERTHVTLALSAEYGSTFRPEKLAQLLFRTSCVTVSGSAVPDRDMYKDWLADYFGLPRDFKSLVRFSPVVSNYTLCLDGLLGLDGITKGLFVGFHVPITNTKWDLNMQEDIVHTGTAFYPAGYMGPFRIEREYLAPSFSMAMQGRTISPSSGQIVPLLFGDMREVRAYGLLESRSDKTGFSDIKLMAGWKKQYVHSHIGLIAVTKLPVSNRRTGILYFQPLLGNGKHWELGGGFTSHYDFFKREQGKRSLGVYCDAVFSHVFPTWEKRTFNMVGLGFGNKLTLLQEILHGSYIGRLIPAINEVALDARIDVLFKADITTKLVYLHDTVNIEMGYTFLANTHERLKEHSPFKAAGIYALKSDAQLYGFYPSNDYPEMQTVTQHNAYLTRGQTPGNTSYTQIYTQEPIRTAFQNVNADNLEITPYYQLNTADRAALGDLPPGYISRSNPPMLLGEANIDYTGVLYPKALSHRFFVHVSKLFFSQDAQVRPSLGVGVAVETAGTSYATNSATSKWGINVGGSLYW